MDSIIADALVELQDDEIDWGMVQTRMLAMLAAAKQSGGVPTFARHLRIVAQECVPSSRPGWPHRLIDRTFNPSQAWRLADELRETLGPGPYAWLRRGGFQLQDTTIAARLGETEALLIPMDGDRFRIAVDSAHPLDRTERPSAETLAARRVFRVCHEIAHSFFYVRTSGIRPHRRTRGGASEERFCDLFAKRITGYDEPPARLR